jgi:hypothetical protein
MEVENGPEEAVTETAPEMKEGDWICEKCSNHNFPWQANCKVCEAPITGGGDMEATGGGGMEASASRTILKYGVITVIGVIPASIVMFFGVFIGSGIADLGVGQTISGAGQSGSIVTFIIGVLIMLVVAVICQLQMITFPIAYAIADSRDDGWRMDYLDTWKTAFEVIFEALPGLGGSFVVVVLGLVIASPSMTGLIGLGLIVSFTGVVWLWLMVIGMVPYIVRKLSMM